MVGWVYTFGVGNDFGFRAALFFLGVLVVAMLTIIALDILIDAGEADAREAYRLSCWQHGGTAMFDTEYGDVCVTEMVEVE